MRIEASHHAVSVACVSLLLALSPWCAARESTASPLGIAEKEITELEKDLEEAGKERSSTRKRRAYKRVVRGARAVLKTAPNAPRRWRVLNVVLRSQKRLVVLENSETNRNSLLETCAELAKAPDEFADLRLEADLLLSERELSLKNADVGERSRALETIVIRYRDTPGEAKSLMMASQIAPKLEAFDLETRILRTMQERFADHHGVIEFRRKSLAAGRIEALFRGTFERPDGTSLSFPVDRLGQQCLMVFWSKRTPGFEVALAKINEQREQFPGRFDFYSLNLDELPDAGEATLRSLDLDWNVLRLPGGKKSQTFRTYGRREPVSILVNAYGYTLLTPTGNYGRGRGGAENPYKIDPVRLTSERYLTQLQSLFIGDFLVDSLAGSKPPGLTASLRAIEECFVPAPFRYRLERQEALASYEKAERLCAAAITKHPQDPDLWRVHHARIIALIGLWKVSGEPKYLEEAVQESRTSLEGRLPDGAAVVPRFCLAKDSLRSSGGGAESILSDLIQAAGGDRAPATAVAAAVILALDANSRELHQHYRDVLLEKHSDDPTVWPVVTFLRDRYHTLDLLKVKLSRPERRIRALYGDLVPPRAHAINHGLDPMTERLPDLTLQTPEGEALTLPKDTEGKLTLLLFVEPPENPEADFPIVLDRKNRPTKNDPLRKVMSFAFEMAERHIHEDVEVIAAFLCDDGDRAKALAEKNEWPCRVAVVPGGLKNSMVRQLGILSADRIPNVFLLRRDGTIAWHTSGFPYRSDFGYPFAVRLAMKVHIEICDSELAYEALAAGDYKKAKKIFSGPFLPEKDERYEWRGPRFHGRALANLGLEDWPAALEDIDISIEAHRKGFRHAEDSPCESFLRLRRVRATILEKLSRGEEAKVEREAAAAEPSAYPTTLYDSFHRRLEELNGHQSDRSGS